MNIPGFTAEDSLYVNRMHYGMAAHHDYGITAPQKTNIVPQRKVKMPFLACDQCGPSNTIDLFTKSGTQTCCDFFCDIPPIHGRGCWKENCRSQRCSRDPKFDFLGG